MKILNILFAAVATLDMELLSQKDLVASAQYNIAKPIRRLLENKNISSVVKALLKGPMSFGELSEETQLKRNDLNHALLEMKSIGLAVQLEDKKYSLTVFCCVIMEAMATIKEEFKKRREDMLLPAIEQTFIEQKTSC